MFFPHNKAAINRIFFPSNFDAVFENITSFKLSSKFESFKTYVRKITKNNNQNQSSKILCQFDFISNGVNAKQSVSNDNNDNDNDNDNDNNDQLSKQKDCLVAPVPIQGNETERGFNLLYQGKYFSLDFAVFILYSIHPSVGLSVCFLLLQW